MKETDYQTTKYTKVDVYIFRFVGTAFSAISTASTATLIGTSIIYDTSDTMGNILIGGLSLISAIGAKSAFNDAKRLAQELKSKQSKQK